MQVVPAAEVDPPLTHNFASRAFSMLGVLQAAEVMVKGHEQAGKLHEEGSGRESGGEVVGHLYKGNTGTEHTENTTDFKNLSSCPGLTLAISLANGLNAAIVLYKKNPTLNI